MARGIGVRDLVELSTGAFTLPDELTQAHDVLIKAQQLPIDAVDVLDIEPAAAQMLAALERGETPDVLDCGRVVEQGNAERRSQGTAQRILAVLRELAAAKAE